MPTLVSLLLLLPPVAVAALVSWLIYECSDTVEQSVISGGSNDKRLTDIDTCNCCTCKVAQYVASREEMKKREGER